MEPVHKYRAKSTPQQTRSSHLEYKRENVQYLWIQLSSLELDYYVWQDRENQAGEYQNLRKIQFETYGKNFWNILLKLVSPKFAHSK